MQCKLHGEIENEMAKILRNCDKTMEDLMRSNKKRDEIWRMQIAEIKKKIEETRSVGDTEPPPLAGGMLREGGGAASFLDLTGAPPVPPAKAMDERLNHGQLNHERPNQALRVTQPSAGTPISPGRCPPNSSTNPKGKGKGKVN